MIIDCDPAGMIATGLDVDDDLAILIAMSLNASSATVADDRNQPKVHVLGLTITAGNTQLKQSYADALELRRRIGIPANQLPILAGARWWPPPSQRPPFRTIKYMETDASRFIIETIRAEPPNTVTILCLGPLTNMAAALQQEPSIANRILSLVVMGGILTPNRRLDYNFRFDRTAASMVMAAPIPKILIPVETAIQAIFNQSDLQQVQSRCDEHTHGSETVPAVCTLLMRLAFQRRIMPWLVNWRYKDISLSPSCIFWTLALFV